MPNDPEKEKIDLEVDDTLAKAEESLEVDLNKQEHVEKASVDEDKLEKLHRRMEYQARQFEKSQKQMAQMMAAMQATQQQYRQPVQTSEQEMDELDQLAQKDWKAAVRKLGQEEAKKILQEQAAEQQRIYREQSNLAALEQSKSRVLSRYPELNDQNSEISRLYMQVQNENPQFLSNPYGPELCMTRLEEKLKAGGKTDAEALRKSRITAASIPTGTAKSSGKVVLTKEEQELAKEMGVSYEEYAKMKLADFKEGVEADES